MADPPGSMPTRPRPISASVSIGWHVGHAAYHCQTCSKISFYDELATASALAGPWRIRGMIHG